MKAHVINLDRSADRWDWMQAQAERAGMVLERVAAVDGRNLSADERAALVDGSPTGAILSAGEIGCVLSHRKAWSAIAAGAELYGAVFEDDLHLSLETGAFIRDDSWIPDGADLVRLETFAVPMRCASTPLKALGDRDLFRVLDSTVGAGGYVISRAFAAQALAATERMHDTADAILFERQSPRFGPRAIYQLSPALCVQDKVLELRNARLESLIEADRLQSWQAAKPRGLRKLRREFGRILKHVGALPGRALSAFGREERKVIAFR